MANDNKSTIIIVVISAVIVSTIVAGSVLTAFSFHIPGMYHRTQGRCRIDNSGQAVRVSGKGVAYKAVWSASVFAIDDVNDTTPIYSNVAAFVGDISATQPGYTSQKNALNELGQYPVGTTLNCIYPSNPLKYPSGTKVTNTRAVYLGNFTQSQQDSAYHKAHAMENAGIALIVIGGVTTLVSLGIVMYNCCKSPY